MIYLASLQKIIQFQIMRTFLMHLKRVKKTLDKSEQKSDQLIPKWVQVPKDRFDFIKLKINTNTNLATMIHNKR